MTEERQRDALRAESASKAGAARMKKLSKAERAALASKAARARWGKPALTENVDTAPSPGALNVENRALPQAKWSGMLRIGDGEIPVYVFEDRRRILGRTGAMSVLTGGKEGLNIEGLVQAKGLESYKLPALQIRTIDFVIPERENKQSKGLSAEAFLEICGAYVRAWQDGALEGEAEVATAKRSAAFLAACSKVGLIALIDEATGYESRRGEDEFQLKLRALFIEEMQKWERTFPDELWQQLARLTNWKGSLHLRPKYWSKLVMDLIYGYLDPDVNQWLLDNAPALKHGESYYLWLSSQHGLEKLIEHIWKVIGVASSCEDGHIEDLQQKIKHLFGEETGVQHVFRLISAERNIANR